MPANDPIVLILSVVMIANGLLAMPFGILANRAFRKYGKLTAPLALWSGVAMHGHALMTFAVAWFDRGSLYNPSWPTTLLGAAAALGGAYIIFLGRKAYGDQARVYGLKEDALITSGIYERSRNPQYVGYALMFLGASAAAGSLFSFAFVAVFALMLHSGITLVEEPHMRRIFGPAYQEYRLRTRRYI